MNLYEGEIQSLCAAIGDMFAGDTLDKNQAETLDRAREILHAYDALRKEAEGLRAERDAARKEADDYREEYQTVLRSFTKRDAQYTEQRERAESAEQALRERMESDLEVAVAQAVEFAQYVEGAAKGAMVERAKHFLSLPYSQELASRLREREGDAKATLEADIDTCVRLRDAEANSRRYLWLKERLDSIDWFYGDPPRSMLMFHIPSNMRVSANLDATIDAEMPKRAAIQAQPLEGESTPQGVP